MNLRVRSSQDVLAGAMFVAFGAAALLLGTELEMGEARRMGPGYFPRVLAGLLVLLGLAVALRGLVRPGEPLQRVAFRPFLTLVGVLLFAVTVDRYGLVVASCALILVSSYAGWEFRWREALVLAVAVTALSVLIFVTGLGMPIPILPQ